MPAVLVDDLEELLVEFCVAFTFFGIEWHANEQVIRNCASPAAARGPSLRLAARLKAQL
jgi:hypothetical protein